MGPGCCIMLLAGFSSCMRCWQPLSCRSCIIRWFGPACGLTPTVRKTLTKILKCCQPPNPLHAAAHVMPMSQAGAKWKAMKSCTLLKVDWRVDCRKGRAQKLSLGCAAVKVCSPRSEAWRGCSRGCSPDVKRT
jgi:hypothetical protein